jgi:probable selenium-dependent hydroxylase accessory protein YqeC
MQVPSSYPVLTDDPVIREMMITSAVHSQIVTVGIPEASKDGRHKMRGLPSEELKELRKFCDVLLIEADGSKRLPVKAPESFEPVIPEMTQLVIGIAGASAIGRPIGEVSCRTERVCDVLRKKPDDLVTAEDLATLLLHERGQKKMVFCDYRAVINQADCLSDHEKQYVERLGILHTSFPVFQRM